MSGNTKHKGETMRAEYTEDYNGHTISIYHDDEYTVDLNDDSVFLVACHNQFTVKYKDFTDKDIIELFLNPTHDEYYLFPLRAYIHSGVSLSLSKTEYPFNDRFDSAWVGMVFIDKNEVNNSEDRAKEIAEGLIQTYNHVLSGEVYGYVISKGGEKVESCWGFIGDYENCLNEAKDVVNNYK